MEESSFTKLYGRSKLPRSIPYVVIHSTLNDKIHNKVKCTEVPNSYTAKLQFITQLKSSIDDLKIEFDKSFKSRLKQLSKKV